MTKDEIKVCVLIQDVLQRYGVEIRRGRCRGFCHDGRDLNMQVSDRIAYCHVCHAKYDVFDIVMHFEQCDFATAKRLLDPSRMSLADEIKAKASAKNFKAEDEKRKATSLAAVDAQCEYLRLTRQRELYKPASPDDPPDPRFLEALEKLEIAELRLQEV